jgi:hypothetical protein
MRVLRSIVVTAGSAGLLALGVVTAAPASAGNVTVSVLNSSVYQYLKTCSSTTGCNVISTTQLNFEFQLSGPVNNRVVLDYRVTHDTAIDGEDFNVPMTGQITIRANINSYDLQVPVVDESEFGITTTFTIAITKVQTRGVSSAGGPATGTIYGGNVALDCSYSHYTATSMSLACTGRPSTQTWHMDLTCIFFGRAIGVGSEVTGEGTSLATCPTGYRNFGTGALEIDS